MSKELSAPLRVDIGIFAHNEAPRIGTLLTDLEKQSVLTDQSVELVVHVLANGCTDSTVPTVRRQLEKMTANRARMFVVHDLKRGGKSRTAHRFIHEISRDDASLLVFVDADIRLPAHDTLSRMISQLKNREALMTYTSRPVKDVDFDGLRVGGVAKAIAMGGGGLTNYRKSICGQLFIMRAIMARRIGVPAGLPVEDGFFRAMMLTDLLQRPEDLNRIDGDPETFHVYESIQSLGELIRHQTRIVVGGAVNAAIYAKIRRDVSSVADAHDLLMAAASDEDWLPETLQQELPTWPFGFVPFDFLTKRIRGERKPGLKGAIVTCAGFGLDALVYALATLRMMRRKAANHW